MTKAFTVNVMNFTPPLSLRDISPKGGDAKRKSVSNFVPSSLKGKGDRGKGF